MAEAAVMHGDISGLVLTLALIALSKALSCLFKGEVKRKVLHIGVSNFALIYLLVFENDVLPVSGLGLFALLNLILEKKAGSTRWRGLVLYPVSIIILILFKEFSLGSNLCVATATLCMGWGDGLAAIFGKLIDGCKMPFSKNKTVEGSMTVFVVSSIIPYIMFSVFTSCSVSIPLCLLCGFATSVAECYTPFGLDNVSVPLVSFFVCCLF